jgi:DNA-binding MarR family transcriptional regulator
MNRDPSPHSIISRIGFMHIRIRKECDKRFREEGFPLEMDQIPVLMILYYQQTLTQQEISSRLERDKASVNRTIGFLIQRDLVKVRPDETDRRKTSVQLTAAGKRLGKRANSLLDDVGRQLAGAFTDTEREQFDRLTSKLVQSMAAPTTIFTTL